ncbi:sterol desaturase family protein [Crocinitomix algicola]|uniref:sterol desaturase family protein n=1 Tax=Crocinitomix algicola TaxID=1740263 RepID=UPI0009F1E506|nr:sterol desaturase family protein [Crocinitomix algicola]
MGIRVVFLFIGLVVSRVSYSQGTESSIVSFFDVFIDSFIGYGGYLWREITFQTEPWYINYFWLLIGLSLLVWLLEIVFPWRKNQPVFRKDFWLDAFYMIFNFFLFRLIIFAAIANITEQGFINIVGGDLSAYSLFNLSSLHPVLQFIIFFLALDFVQWFTHFLLHRFNFLWRFHQVHHSVEQMGFAAHLRYHWMENVFYTPMKYLAMLFIGGFTLETAFIAHYLAIAIGHINHANIDISYGPLKYVFNNPRMHIWHHAYELPDDHQYGANFGISLSLWDYIFRTNYVPYSGRDIRLGFKDVEQFPKSFWKQLFYGFWNKESKKMN